MAASLAVLLMLGASRWLPVDGVSAATRPGQSVVGSVSTDYELIQPALPTDQPLSAPHTLTLVRWANNLSYGLANLVPPGPAAALLITTADTDSRVVDAVEQLVGHLFAGVEVIVAEFDETAANRSRVDLSSEPRRPLPTYTNLRAETLPLPQSVALADIIIVVRSAREDGGVMRGCLDLIGSIADAGGDDSLRVDAISAVAPHFIVLESLQPHGHLLASHDPVAIDAVAARLALGGTASDTSAVSGDQVRVIELAAATGLGKLWWKDIKLNGSAVSGVPQPKQAFGGPAGATRR